MKKKVVLYMRVSTNDQTTENQLIKLQEIAELREWEIIDKYIDEGISGKKFDRPELNRLMTDARKGRFNTVFSVRVDRVGRSLIDLIGIAGKLGEYNVDLKFTDQDFDINAPMGKFMYQVMGAFAELEREMITQRINEGLHRARKQGKHLGRRSWKDPGSKSYVPPEKARKIREMKEEGVSYREISRITGVTLTTVYRVISGVSKSSPQKIGGDTIGNGPVCKPCDLETVEEEI